MTNAYVTTRTPVNWNSSFTSLIKEYECEFKILTLKFVCTICTGYVMIVAITEAKAPIKKALVGLGLKFP